MEQKKYAVTSKNKVVMVGDYDYLGGDVGMIYHTTGGAMHRESLIEIAADAVEMFVKRGFQNFTDIEVEEC